MFDGVASSTQCRAVRSQLGRISAAPQKWPPPRVCNDAAKGYGSVASTPPTMVVLGGVPGSGSATAGGAATANAASAVAGSSVLTRILRITSPHKRKGEWVLWFLMPDTNVGNWRNFGHEIGARLDNALGG